MDNPENSHPLKNVNTVKAENWSEWKRLWRSSNGHFEHQHSLLHFGFKIECPYSDAVDRILTYLRIADGYCNEDTFRGDQLRSQQLNYDLARKAFEALSLNFFKRPTTVGGPDSDLTWLCRNPLLDVILRFFRAEKGNGGFWHLRNLEKDYFRDVNHHVNNAKDFLLELVAQLMNYDAGAHWGDNHDQRFPTRKSRPQFVELLVGLDRLDLLLPIGGLAIDSAIRFDKDSLAQLEVIAMRAEYHFPNDERPRRPKTLEEASYIGSKAARTLVLIRQHEKERERFEKIAEVEREREKLERRLKELKD